MKTLIIALAIFSANAFAAKVEIAEIGSNEVRIAASIRSDYGINPSLNRAWVNVTLQSDNDTGDTHMRVLVPGLSIVGNAVVLDVEGQQVECAKIRKVGIFRTEVARATKNCKFTVAVKKTPVDDGFEVRIRKSFVLSLETR